MYLIDSCVRGLHVSKHFWTTTIGETIVCKREPEKLYAYAVAVMANSIMVGHVPIGPQHVRYFCTKTGALFTGKTEGRLLLKQ